MRQRAVAILMFATCLLAGLYAQDAPYQRQGEIPRFSGSIDHSHRSEHVISSPRGGEQIGHDVRFDFLSVRLSSSATFAPTASIASTAPGYAEWTRVAVCEEGGWRGYVSYDYPDSLGIDRANWIAYGGGAGISPADQVAVAERLATALGIGVPDQSSCESW